MKDTVKVIEVSETVHEHKIKFLVSFEKSIYFRLARTELMLFYSSQSRYVGCLLNGT